MSWIILDQISYPLHSKFLLVLYVSFRIHTIGYTIMFNGWSHKKVSSWSVFFYSSLLSSLTSACQIHIAPGKGDNKLWSCLIMTIVITFNKYYVTCSVARQKFFNVLNFECSSILILIHVTLIIRGIMLKHFRILHEHKKYARGYKEKKKKEKKRKEKKRKEKKRKEKKRKEKKRKEKKRKEKKRKKWKEK